MGKRRSVRLQGNWTSGVALDVHTTGSEFLGYDVAGRPRFDTRRTELGEALYSLKYQGRKDRLPTIVDAAVAFLTAHRGKFDILVPIPPSTVRVPEPVRLIGDGIAAALGLEMSHCLKHTRPASALKHVQDPAERQRLIDGLYAVDRSAVLGRNVLLVDDVHRSGTTLTAATDVLLTDGGAASVRVLAITTTRSNQ